MEPHELGALGAREGFDVAKNLLAVGWSGNGTGTGSTCFAGGYGPTLDGRRRKGASVVWIVDDSASNRSLISPTAFDSNACESSPAYWGGRRGSRR